MATFDFNNVGAQTPITTSGATLETLYNIEGVGLWPPPENVRIEDNYRVTVKQVAVGQVADKGGAGGSSISVSGKVPWKWAAWLLWLERRLLESASDESFVVMYDPVNRRTYECVCKSIAVTKNTIEPHFYHYEIRLWGQVLGEQWVDAPLVEETRSEGVQAFDLDALGWMIDDVELSAAAYDNYIADTNAPAVSGGTGTQAPTLITDDLDRNYGGG